MKTDRLRNFVFTLNNYTPEEEEAVKEFIKAQCKYGVFGHEVGEKKGTPHLQGYAELKKQTRFRTLKKMMPRRVANIAPRRGTAQEASDYCLKDDPAPFVYGKISKSGQRSDLESYCKAITEGKTPAQLHREMPVCNAKYYKYADYIRKHLMEEKNSGFHPVEVIVLWGEAGAGKTRTVYEEEPGLWALSHSSTKSQAVWFDGYRGQEAILIDDFYGGCMSYEYFLRLLDGFRFQIPVKGGFTWKMWKKVYITSNEPPESWYPNGLTPALKRRLTHVIECTKDEEKQAPC